MSQIPASGAPRHSSPLLSRTATRNASGAQGKDDETSLPTVGERSEDGLVRILLPASQFDAATADTLRRLTSLLKGMEPVDTKSLQSLRDLCTQLHDSQSAIDAALACGPATAPGRGFQLAAIALVERLQRALGGQQPALALRQLGDVEAICLGLCAFASVKAPSPFVAPADIMERACHALDGVTASLLAVIQRHRIDDLEYSQALAVHNWVSRACKARLLKQDSLCWKQVQSFSAGIFEKFSDHAVAAHRDSGMTMALNEHNIGKTAAELKAMLEHGLVSFSGKEEELARVAAWLSSKAAFQILLSSLAGVGLANLFSLFKSLLDLSARKEADTASGEGEGPDRPDAFALLWKQMIASIVHISPERLLDADGRFLASCANLLRALYESGLPKTWTDDQCLAFSNAGRRLIGMIGCADPDNLRSLSLHTIANMISFIKAWHRHERHMGRPPVSGSNGLVDTADRTPRQSALAPEVLDPMQVAAKQLGALLSPGQLEALETSATVGGLLTGLCYLCTNGLLATGVAKPLLVGLAQALAAIDSWERNYAIRIVKSLMSLFKRRVLDWDGLQPAFCALMGPPPQGETWHEDEVQAFMRGEIERRPTMSLPIDRYLNRDAVARVKPVRTHVVGDHPLPMPDKPSEELRPAPLPTSLTRILPSMPRYAERDADGFIVSSRVAKAATVQANAPASRALFASDREIEDEDACEPGEPVAAPYDTAKTSPPSVPPGGNKRGRKKIRLLETIGCASDDDMASLSSQSSNAASGPVSKATAAGKRRAIYREFSAAISDKDEKKALALLAGPRGRLIAGALDAQGDSLLYVAIQAGMFELTLAMLAYPRGKERAADASTQGVTPLRIAAYHGHMPLVEALLDIEEVVLDINHQDASGNDAVSAAVRKNHPEVLERLMKIEAVWQRLPRHLYSDGQDVLALAVANKSANALEALLKHPELARRAAMPLAPATMDNWDSLADSTLARRAATASDMQTLGILLRHEAVRAAEAKSNSPFNLYASALYQDNSMAKQLLHLCPEMKRLAGLCLTWGYTPLMLAVFSDNTEEFDYLMAHPEVRAAILASPRKAHPMAAEGFKLKGTDYSDALELAIKRGRLDMATTILAVKEAGEAIDNLGAYTQKVLLLLIRHGTPDMLKRLLENHPKVARIACIADGNGMTALHWVAQSGRGDIAAVLLSKPWLPVSEIKRENREGKDAIALAREAGNKEMADGLAAYHAYHTRTGQKQ